MFGIFRIPPRLYSSLLLQKVHDFWHFWQKSTILQSRRGFTHRCFSKKSMIFDIFDNNLWFLTKIHDFSTQFWHYSSLQIWLYHRSRWYNTVGITYLSKTSSSYHGYNGHWQWTVFTILYCLQFSFLEMMNDMDHTWKMMHNIFIKFLCQFLILWWNIFHAKYLSC